MHMDQARHHHNYYLHIGQNNILKSFFDTSPVLMGIVDLEDNDIRHIFSNQASADYFGLAINELEGKLSRELGFSHEAIREWIGYFRIAEATGDSAKFEYHVRNRTLSATVNFIEKTDYGNSRFSYIVLDISDLKTSHHDLEIRVSQRTVELERQKAQMEAVFESVTDGIMVFDMNFNAILINDAEANICGYADSNELKRNFKYFTETFELKNPDGSIIPPSEWPISQIMKGKVIKDLELIGRRKDTGQEWFFSYSGEPVYNEQGEQILSVCINKDITEYKKAAIEQSYIQRDLANSESRYRYLFVNNPLPMFVYDQENLKFLDVNHSALSFYGHTRDEFLNMTMKDIEPAGLNKHIRKNGEVASVETHGHDLYFENHKSRLVLVNDVTQRELVETNLKDTVEKLESALKNVSDYKFALDQASILATTDANGIITYVNDKFCEISKYEREELIGKNHRVVNSGYHSKQFFKEFWTTIKQGKVWKGEICNRAKDGSLYWVDTVIVPFLDLNGKPYQYVAVRNDITDRKANQAALEEAINSRDEFLSLASHELKTPLTSLKLHTQMAIRHKDKPGRIPKFLEQANKQIQRLTVLIDDMLDISRIATGKLSIKKSEVELINLVEDVIDRMHALLAQSGCNVKTSFPDECIGFWDRFRIEQVVANLLTNAAKYGVGRPIEVVIVKTSNQAKIIIRDHGIGIAEEDKSRIFKRFERAISSNEVSGLGLGLYISYQIIRMHDGSIDVESKLNQGSTFTVTLPL